MRETQDPLGLCKTRLLEAGFATEEEIKAIESRAKALVNKSAEEAQAAPLPTLDHLVTHIFTGEVQHPRTRTHTHTQIFRQMKDEFLNLRISPIFFSLSLIRKCPTCADATSSPCIRPEHAEMNHKIVVRKMSRIK